MTHRLFSSTPLSHGCGLAMHVSRSLYRWRQQRMKGFILSAFLQRHTVNKGSSSYVVRRFFLQYQIFSLVWNIWQRKKYSHTGFQEDSILFVYCSLTVFPEILPFTLWFIVLIVVGAIIKKRYYQLLHKNFKDLCTRVKKHMWRTGKSPEYYLV